MDQNIAVSDQELVQKYLESPKDNGSDVSFRIEALKLFLRISFPGLFDENCIAVEGKWRTKCINQIYRGRFKKTFARIEGEDFLVQVANPEKLIDNKDDTAALRELNLVDTAAVEKFQNITLRWLKAVKEQKIELLSRRSDGWMKLESGLLSNSRQGQAHQQPSISAGVDVPATGASGEAASMPVRLMREGVPELPSSSRLPPRPAHWIDLPEKLECLAAKVQAFPMVVIKGNPGIGKTELALEFLRQAQAQPPSGNGAWDIAEWIDMDGRDVQQFRYWLAGIAGLDYRQLGGERIEGAAGRSLKGRRTVLLLDNVEGLLADPAEQQELLQCLSLLSEQAGERLRLVLTSTVQVAAAYGLDPHHWDDLKPFSPPQADRLLELASAKLRDDPAARRRLIEVTGCNARALVQAAELVEKCQDLESTVQRIEQGPGSVRQSRTSTRKSDPEWSINRMTQLALAELQDARELLILLAELPAGVPQEVFGKDGPWKGLDIAWVQLREWYSFHETRALLRAALPAVIRRYLSGSLLDESPHPDRWVGLARWYLERLELAPQKSAETGGTSTLRNVVEAEGPNFEALFRRLETLKKPENLASLALMCSSAFGSLSRLDDARKAVDRALSADLQPEHPLRGYAWMKDGQLLSLQGKYEQAHGSFAKSLECFERGGYLEAQVYARQGLAENLCQQERWPEALEDLKLVAQQLEASRSQPSRPRALWFESRLGDVLQAASSAHPTMTMADWDREERLGWTYWHMGRAHRYSLSGEEAARYFQKADAKFREIRFETARLHCDAELAVLRLLPSEDAERLPEKLRSRGHLSGEAYAYCACARVAFEDGRFSDSASYAEKGAEIDRKIGNHRDWARNLRWWGKALVELGQVDRARSLLVEAEQIFERLKIKPAVERAGEDIKRLSPMQGDGAL